MMNVWQGMQAPQGLSYDESALTPTHGVFWAEPLEKGYGVTIGNSLRRVLLSSLMGAAITRIRIAGIQHEFSSVPGVAEDATDLILNLKGVVVKYQGEGPATIRLKKSEPGPVLGGDIDGDGIVEIVNKDHYICVLDADSTLFIEMEVETGRGFVAGRNNYREDYPIGWIPIDSIYSPVLKVRYEVENTRVNNDTEFEKLILDVTTNGTISPLDAVTASSKILMDHYGIFVGNREVPGTPAAAPAKSELKVDKKLMETRVEELELPARALNCLIQADIQTVGDLISKTEDEIMKTPHLGKKSLSDIKERLESMGLALRPE